MPERPPRTPEEGADHLPSHTPTEADPAADPQPTGEASTRRRRLAMLAGFVAVLLIGAFVVDRRGDGPPQPPPGSWTLVPYTGLGTWIDVYDWTAELTGGNPAVNLDDIDAMADQGIQTVFVQVAHTRSAATDIIEPDRLNQLIERAHAEGMHVVAWYLPTFVDPAADLRRLVAAARLPVDGVAVDIESVELADPVERNRRLLELTAALRAEVGDDRPIGAITLSSVHLDVVNPAFWPGYPWPELAEAYDVMLPMAYWSIRRDELRSGSRYVGENMDRIRALTGSTEVPVHPIGGIADGVTVDDVAGMLTAASERGAVGASLYDWATAAPELWSVLQPVRDLRTAP